ncbi:Ig-like domain-containing protein [Robinsoniella sp. KNHs210]|uniref:Ig-like domain-containing protein n=1 Tax=Robinsoniella sp. KNHs210 TaxID=1469950 RepID=UPI000693A333|nr:Ig-like domain-containing protein [Robinsoniella sp. KNHs210]
MKRIKIFGERRGKKVLALILAVILAAAPAFDVSAASETGSTEELPHLTTWVEKNKQAPMVWSTIQYSGNQRYYDRITQNIDWLSKEWLQYGYNYAVLDGWLAQKDDGSTAPYGSYLYNKNGYLITPYKEWEKSGATYESFAKYCLDRGITPGVYYNPMWVYKRTVNDVNEDGEPNNINPVVAGTNIPLRDIINTGTSPIGTSEGRKGDDLAEFQSWYYVDPNKEGAKEYMQGMIKYFKDMGYGFMKIDFIRQGHYFYGQEAMEKVYRWWREAAGDDFIISFANARQVDYMGAETEYADMNRISADTNGWARLCSENRGTVQRSEWDTCKNGFDAYNYFSERVAGGPKAGEVILDGDHTRTNQLTVDETKFSIALKVLNGSGIQMSDTVENTVGNAQNQVKPWAFKNWNFINLVKEGFFAKPLKEYKKQDVYTRGKYDLKDQTYDQKTQIWTGQAENGDWIVGLFNREDTPEVRSIDLKEDLGLEGAYQALDLWENKVVGEAVERWSEELPAHACRVLRLSRTDYISLNESQLELSINGGLGNYQLTAEVFAENEEDITVNWSSSDIDVADVSKEGMVTAIGTGTAVITAASSSDPNLTASCTVKVYDFNGNIEQIILSESDIEINMGTQILLYASLEPEYAGNRNVVWSSSNQDVASVDNGMVTGISLGETRIRCTSTASEAVFGECVVRVTPRNIEYGDVIGVTLDRNVVSMLPGKTTRLHAEITNAEDDATINWKSLDETIATVNAEGIVTVVGNGCTTILAQVNGKEEYAAQCIVYGALEDASYETELSKGHTLNGTKAKTNKSAFSNKAGTGNIGNSATNNFLLMDVDVPEAGLYNFGLYYAQNNVDTQDTGLVAGGASRSVYVTSDGGVSSKFLVLQGTISGNFDNPEQEPASTTLELKAGTNELKLYNSKGWCSDLDKFSITKAFPLTGTAANVAGVRDGGKTFVLTQTVISGTMDDLKDYEVAGEYTIYRDNEAIASDEVEGQTGMEPVQSSGGRARMNGFVYQRDFQTEMIDVSGYTEPGSYTVIFTAIKDGIKVESQPLFLFKIPYPLEIYTVSYDLNGGEGTVPEPIIKEEGTKVTIAEGDGFSRTGYTFIGWNTQMDGCGAVYLPASELEVGSNMVLYAQWKKIADKTDLKDAYNKYKELIEKDYTSGSWDVFSIALINAGKILEADDAGEEEVAEAAEMLETAVKDLKKISDLTWEELLEEMVAQAEKAQAQAEEAKKQAEEARQQAQQDRDAAETAKAEAEKAKQEAKTAEAEAKEARDQAIAAKDQAEMAKIESEKQLKEAEKAKIEAEEASKQAEEAKNQAGADSAAAKEAEQKAKEKAEAAEAAQLAAEKAQNAAELAMEQAEQNAAQADIKMQQAETAMKKAEAAQKQAETDRIAAETAMEQAEAERQAAETARIKAGEECIAAEATKKAAEAERQAAETAKEAAEAERQAAEAAKEAAEAAKKAAEEESKKSGADRAAAEQALKAAEAARIKAENAQKAAEKARAEAEKANADAQKTINSQRVTVKKVTLKSVKNNGKKAFKAVWTKVSGVTGYELQYALNSKFKNADIKKAGGAKTSCTIKKLKSKKKYYVRIRAYKTVNKKLVYGPYSKVFNVRVK